ncbi:hypothetical protein ACFX2G_035082 [Malus domestica]
MESDLVVVLRKAKIIKARLEAFSIPRNHPLFCSCHFPLNILSVPVPPRTLLIQKTKNPSVYLIRTELALPTTYDMSSSTGGSMSATSNLSVISDMEMLKLGLDLVSVARRNIGFLRTTTESQ